MSSKGIALGIASLLQANLALADWFCTHASSRRIGSTFEVCGTGKSEDEASARINAFDHAKLEFDKICSNSSDCRGQAHDITPGRSECVRRNNFFECKRFFQFELAKEDASSERAADETKVKNFIEKYISKRELIKRLGPPSEIVEQVGSPSDQKEFIYTNKEFCINKTRCTVNLKFDRVERYSNFNPTFTEEVQGEATFWTKFKRQTGFQD